MSAIGELLTPPAGMLRLEWYAFLALAWFIGWELAELVP